LKSVTLHISKYDHPLISRSSKSYLLKITSKTVDSFWDGEAVDLHMAVDALLTYDDDSRDEE